MWDNFFLVRIYDNAADFKPGLEQLMEGRCLCSS
jgi:hypothetical protein